MRKIFSSADYEPNERFDAWHEAARRYVTDHDSRPDSRDNFAAHLSAATIDDLTLVSFESVATRVSHGARHIARSADELIVCRQVAGEMVFEQSGRTATLRPGALTLLDPRLPYSGHLLTGAAALVLRIPRARLQSRVGRTRNMLALTLPPMQGENGLISDFLALLPTHVEGLAGSPGSSVVADRTLDLLALALMKATDQPDARVSSPRFVVLSRLRAEIEKRLVDPGLTPALAAAAAGISVRYANDLLADEQTSLARFIQTRRLERCREALSDPSQPHRLISEIAYAWGFSDMTHFGRRFKAAYGLLPSEYRIQQYARP